ncbi:MAG: hypothetical protein ACI9W4_002320 [Rhodothermales bacterium]|jgi:hypothetical protein
MPEPAQMKPKAPSPSGKIGRLTDEAKGLVDDTRQWVDAKLRLFELDFEEKLDGIANKVVAGASVVFLAGLALLFGLLALALLLGDIWGRQSLGFIAVAGGCFLVAVLIHWLRPRFVKGSMGVADKAREARKALPAATETKQLSPPVKGKQA